MTDILIVDDDAAITELIQEVLEMEGYVVATAPHGRAALDWLTAAPTPPRALLVDISMPEMDGPTLIARTREMPALSTMAVVVMTAERRPQHRLHGLPVAGIITKPFHLDALLAHISEAVNHTALAA
jgi:two-component system response regulator CpxR